MSIARGMRTAPSRRRALATALALAATPVVGPALGQDEPGLGEPRGAESEGAARGAPPGASSAGRRRGKNEGKGEGKSGSKNDGETPARLALPPTPGLPPGAKTGTTAVNGTTLFFAELGAGQPVLFLHGGFGSANYWGRQAAALAATHRVILMDTRGHGRSPVMAPAKGKAFGFSLFAGDVEGLLDHLGIPAASIVGWSDGGITGLQLAMSRPQRVRRLFAFGANASPDGLIPGGARAPAFAAYAARCKAEYAVLSPAPERWPDLVAGLRAMWRSEPNFSKGALASITVPTTIAAAQHDELIKPAHAAMIAETIPGAALVPLQGVSHFAMLQDPDRFTAALRAFLAG